MTTYPKSTPAHLAITSPAGKAVALTTKYKSASDMKAAFRTVQPGPAIENSNYPLPVHGAYNPGSDPTAPTPGSFAHKPDIGGPYTFSSPDTPGMPKPSTKTAWNFLPPDWTTTLSSPGLPGEVSASPQTEGVPFSDFTSISFQEAPKADGSVQLRTVTYPSSFTPITQLESARLGIITPEMHRVAQREPHLTPTQIRDEIAAGRLIIPANIHHLKKNLDPMAIGRASKTKVNANMGASPISSGTEQEVEKLQWAEQWGADTVMDLSTGGDLDACRAAIIENATVPIGTVPIYSMIIGKKIEDLDHDLIMDTLGKQAKQGVDYFTIHAGIKRAHLKFVKNRVIGIVSRGGSLLAKWMLVHNQENIMYTMWDEICQLMRQHDVAFSIGDGLRPGGLADATDFAQLAELEVIAELTERAWTHGLQVMVEGPGHVPFDQIEYNAKLQRTLCHGAPFYVLGPLVTDVFPGYDHITSAIGATSIAYHGASMLCYVTPKEHLGLPKKGDVKEGCIAYKIAAHAADVALGIPGTRDWDDELTKARAALNWNKHFELAFDEDTARAYHDEDLDVDTDFCAMCGHDWCSVRISMEIKEFQSGNAEGFERGAAVKSAALTPEQQQILSQRGYLSPEEIHKLATKTKKAMTQLSSPAPAGEVSAKQTEGVPEKASCHSDYVDPDAAQQAQTEVLVQLNTAPAHGIASEDRLI